MRWMVGAVLIAGLALTGCFAPLDLSNRQCPCTTGYQCVAGRCVADGTDAGVVDAGDTIDTGPDDAGIVTCPDGVFCEDFEGSSPVGNGWTVDPDFVRVGFVSARSPDPNVTPHRGSGMVRITTTTPGGQASLVICPPTHFSCPADLPDGGVPPGITSGDIYMRAYLYAPTNLPDGSPFTMGHASVLWVGAHSGPWASGEDVTGFNLDVDRASMYLGTIGERVEPRPAAGDADARPMFPRDTWTCVRVHVHVDPVAGVAETFLGSDDVPEVVRTGIDTVSTLPFLHFGVGLGYTEEMPNGAAIYADDVAVSFAGTPIPCLE